MDGQRMSDYTIPEKAQKIGLMFQNPSTIHMRTLNENASLP